MKEKTLPRILIGGSGSGCGKTTVVVGLLKALMDQNKKPAAFKCGPDYIDPMFHSQVIGAKARNLDLYMCGPDAVNFILGQNGEEDGISVIEGVMGMFDGLSFDDPQFSASDISLLTETPALLVVSVKGKSASLLAEISGYLNYYENNIKGVILNRCSKGMYPVYKKAIETHLPVKAYGYLPPMDNISIESRHLGLITSDEVEGLKEKTTLLGDTAAETLDLAGIIELASSAPKLVYNEELFACEPLTKEPVKIAVPKDKAFCFYYEENIQLMRKLGCEICYFSPLSDKHLPKDISAIYLGGGYPELYGEELERNDTIRQEIKEAGLSGMPIYGECGGYMYLGKSIEHKGATHEMVGLLSGHSFMTGGLVRFGYKNLIANKDNILCKKGQAIKAHEFHYSDSDCPGSTFTSVNRRGSETEAIDENLQVLGGYPHLHFYSNMEFAVNFVSKAIEFRDSTKK